MNKETFFYKQGVNYKRVNKTVARKYYDKGCNIIIAPVNANMYYSLCNLYSIHNKGICGLDFDVLMNNFSFYRLNQGLGNYAKYYVNEYDLKVRIKR